MKLNLASLVEQLNTSAEQIDLAPASKFYNLPEEEIKQFLLKATQTTSVDTAIQSPLFKRQQFKLMQKKILHGIIQKNYSQISDTNFNFKQIKANDKEIFEMRKKIQVNMKNQMRQLGVKTYEEEGMNITFERWE